MINTKNDNTCQKCRAWRKPLTVLINCQYLYFVCLSVFGCVTDAMCLFRLHFSLSVLLCSYLHHFFHHALHFSVFLFLSLLLPSFSLYLFVFIRAYEKVSSTGYNHRVFSLSPMFAVAVPTTDLCPHVSSSVPLS